MLAANLHVIVGLGATGFSCVRYFVERGINVAVMDSRSNPPYLSVMRQSYADVPLMLGEFDAEILNSASKIILSPGISLNEPAIQVQLNRGVPIIGDVELFARTISVPVIAITGTNAKSTVTTLVGQMAKAAGYQVMVGGNLGTPVLDLIQEGANTNLFVIELSSFQLETLYSLRPAVASVLNISPDHMDRYQTLDDYRQAKLRIYRHSRIAVCNKDDPLTECHQLPSTQKYYFTIDHPEENEFGLLTQQNETYLAYGNQSLLATREIPVSGKHYQANALAALAIGHGFGLSFEPMLQVLREFKGLPHRCELVRELDGVKWFNDSKGTNVGATVAAIDGLGSTMTGKIVLIAGGVGKNADFSVLLPTLKKYVRHVVLIGESAKIIASVLNKHISYSFAGSMEDAACQAKKQAAAGDAILLSPACASFDMFKNFEHRGEVFMQVAETL